MDYKTKITVVGSGYVGMSLAVLLSCNNEVTVLDVDIDRVESINKKQSTISDKEIELYLSSKALNLNATIDKKKAYKNSNFIIVATPTNYDSENNSFDTRSVDQVVEDSLNLNPTAIVVIKSTIPVGHTKYLQTKFGTDRVIFSPEFLREGHALKDNLYPSRIIVGNESKLARDFSILLQNAAKAEKIETLFMPSTEAEAVKLFSNTYLAMRVAYFNELDSYAHFHKLNTKNIIDGVCYDQRIGTGYNNPSFGYGGYCLPKDTKQLQANFNDIPQSLISAIVESNSVRKDYLANEIIQKNPSTVGFFRLIMKEGSDNFRSSAIQGIIKRIKEKGVKVVIFEPQISDQEFFGCSVINDINYFKEISSIIVANRISEELSDVLDKCFSRDIYGNN